MAGPPQSDRVPVAEGVALRVLRRPGGGGIPFVLVHGLASNAHLWDGVAARLADLGHAVVAVDQRGHGRSDRPDHGYDLATACSDLQRVIEATGLERPVAVGQSWGGNVVLELAAREPTLLAGVACVDGGWIELADRFPNWEECREALRPPATEGMALAEIEAIMRRRHPDWPEEGIAGALANWEHRPDGTVAPWLTVDRHLALLRALWEHRPSRRYADVTVPVLLMPASGGAPGTGAAAVTAAAALRRARVHPFDGDHDIHAQRPDGVAAVLHAATDGWFG